MILTFSMLQLWEMLSDDGMKYYQNALIEKIPFTFDVNKTDSLDISFIAMKTISLLLLQMLDMMQSNREHRTLVESDCLIYLVSSLLAAIASVIEVLNNHNKLEEEAPFTSNQKVLTNCLNSLSCGSLWLSSIISTCNLILRNIQQYNHETLSLPLSILAKSVLSRTTPVALGCLKCVSGTFHGGTSSESCLRLCLSLIRSSTHLAVTYHNIKEKMLGGINTDHRESNLDISNFVEKDSPAAHSLWTFLVNILDETKV